MLFFRCSSPLKPAKHSKARKYIHVAWSRHPWFGHFEYLADSIGWWGVVANNLVCRYDQPLILNIVNCRDRL